MVCPGVCPALGWDAPTRYDCPVQTPLDLANLSTRTPAAAFASMPTSPNFLHVSLASRLMDEIERGLWAAGQRLPSVREMSRRRAVSVTTVLAAYRALEDRQAIESRPQKGFYVRAGAARCAVLPRAPATIVDAEVSHAALNRIDDSAHFVSFGTALCEKELFPVGALSRSIALAARRHGELLTEVSFSSGSKHLRESLASHARTWNCGRHPGDERLYRGIWPVPSGRCPGGRCHRRGITGVLRVLVDDCAARHVSHPAAVSCRSRASHGRGWTAGGAAVNRRVSYVDER